MIELLYIVLNVYLLIGFMIGFAPTTQDVVRLFFRNEARRSIIQKSPRKFFDYPELPKASKIPPLFLVPLVVGGWRMLAWPFKYNTRITHAKESFQGKYLSLIKYRENNYEDYTR